MVALLVDCYHGDRMGFSNENSFSSAKISSYGCGHDCSNCCCDYYYSIDCDYCGNPGSEILDWIDCLKWIIKEFVFIDLHIVSQSNAPTIFVTVIFSQIFGTKFSVWAPSITMSKFLCYHKFMCKTFLWFGIRQRISHQINWYWMWDLRFSCLIVIMFGSARNRWLCSILAEISSNFDQFTYHLDCCWKIDGYCIDSRLVGDVCFYCLIDFSSENSYGDVASSSANDVYDYSYESGYAIWNL